LKASDGWFLNFKRRHELSFKKINGEAMDVDRESDLPFKEKFIDNSNNYKLKTFLMQIKRHYFI